MRVEYRVVLVLPDYIDLESTIERAAWAARTLGRDGTQVESVEFVGKLSDVAGS